MIRKRTFFGLVALAVANGLFAMSAPAPVSAEEYGCACSPGHPPFCINWNDDCGGNCSCV